MFTKAFRVSSVKNTKNKAIVYLVLKESIPVINKQQVPEAKFDEAQYFGDVQSAMRLMPNSLSQTECNLWVSTLNRQQCRQNTTYTYNDIKWEKALKTEFKEKELSFLPEIPVKKYNFI